MIVHQDAERLVMQLFAAWHSGVTPNVVEMKTI